MADHQAAGIAAQIEHQTGEIASAELLDGVADQPAGIFIEAGDAQIADARPAKKARSTVDSCTSSGVRANWRKRTMPARRTTRWACSWRD